jgi:hypothetical protein
MQLQSSQLQSLHQEAGCWLRSSSAYASMSRTHSEHPAEQAATHSRPIRTRRKYDCVMAEPLKGVEFRVFRSLIQEEDFDTVEKIGMHLTLGPMVATSEIEAALDSLAVAGYVEERKPGHWRITSQGHAVKQSLLGDLIGG